MLGLKSISDNIYASPKLSKMPAPGTEVRSLTTFPVRAAVSGISVDRNIDAEIDIFVADSTQWWREIRESWLDFCWRGECDASEI